jgi:hypothetical protein
MKSHCAWCHQADDFVPPGLVPTLIPRHYATCPIYHRQVTLIDVPSACAVVKKSRKTIYQWIKTGRIKTVRLADGRCLICYSSLFLPPDEEDA